ncbi:hypothetical protein JW964_02875 [candidate division KSB1 bacterium]|nr:hypothetical protein [candidate division KSB1 bacterium]
MERIFFSIFTPMAIGDIFKNFSDSKRNWNDFFCQFPFQWSLEAFSKIFLTPIAIGTILFCQFPFQWSLEAFSKIFLTPTAIGTNFFFNFHSNGHWNDFEKFLWSR